MANEEKVNRVFAMDGNSVGSAASPQKPNPVSVQKPKASLPKESTAYSQKSVKGGV